MTENIMNPDDWFAGIERPHEDVKLYQKPAIANEIHALEDQLEKIEDSGGEASLGHSEADALNVRLATLYEQFDASSLTVRVQNLSDDEIEALTDAADRASKDDADKAAEKARGRAKVQCDREGVKDAKQRTERIAAAGRQATAQVVAREYNFQIMAACARHPETLDPIYPVERWKAIIDVLGEGQMQRVIQAFNRVTSDAPEVTVPKSSRRGTSVEEDSL